MKGLKGADGNTIGQRIGILREAKGYTSQEKLADALGVPRTTLNNWEQDERELKAGVIVALAEALGVSTDYLLGISNNPSRDESIDGACRCTGISEKAVLRIQSLRESDGKAERVSSILEAEQFPRLIEYLDDIAFSSEQVSAAVEQLEAIREPVPDATFEEDEDGRMVLKSGDPVKQSLMVNAEMDIREYLPKLRVQLLEVNELWSELLETILPTKDIVRRGIDQSKRFGIR